MTEMTRMTGIPGTSQGAWGHDRNDKNDMNSGYPPRDIHDVLRARIFTPQGDCVSLHAIVSNC
jgi:hypothetical protein